MKKEKWLPVVGFEKYYQVSDKGRVKQLERQMAGKRSNCKMEEKFKTLCKHGSGYLTVCLLTKNRKLVHRLVAEAFIPNPLNHTDVNHKDWNKSNNNLDNLEWCSHKQNLIHAYKNPKVIKTAHTKAKRDGASRSIKERCSGFNVYKNGVFIKYFDSLADCATGLKLSYPSNIYNVTSGRCKHHKGYFFEKVPKKH